MQVSCKAVVLQKGYLQLRALAQYIEALVQVPISQGYHLYVREALAVCVIEDELLSDASWLLGQVLIARRLLIKSVHSRWLLSFILLQI